MILYMIMFMACLSRSKSQGTTETSTQSSSTSSIPVVEKDESKVTTINGTLNDSTHLESPTTQSPEEGNTLHSNIEMSSTIGSGLLEIQQPTEVETNKTEEDTEKPPSSVDYWGFTKSKFQSAWNKVTQIGSRALQTTKIAATYIGNKFNQLIEYMKQGEEIVETLQGATDLASLATSSSEKQSFPFIKGFVAMFKQVLKIIKSILKTDPIEIEKEREGLAE